MEWDSWLQALREEAAWYEFWIFGDGHAIGTCQGAKRDLTLYMTEIPEKEIQPNYWTMWWFGYLKCIEVLGCIDGSH